MKKMKKISFGDFEEVETLENLEANNKVTEPYAKQLLTEFFEKQKSKLYDGVYITYPHQCLSEQYAPHHSSDDILEIYIYSLPESVTATPVRKEYFLFGGKEIRCFKGQGDGFTFASLPKDHVLLTDDAGQQYGLKYGNKIWIAFDICHSMSAADKSADKLFESIFATLADEVIDPPSIEELEQRLVKKIQRLVNKSRDDSIEAFKNDIHVLESETSLSQERFALLIRNLSGKHSQLELVEQSKPKNGQEIINRIKTFKWIDKVFIQKGMLSVATHDILLGPYNYGKWTITLAESNPQMQHEQWLKEIHPYEYSSNHTFCLGGFVYTYVKAMHAGLFDKALAVCRMEITNYSTETKMHPLEKWLSKTMGEAKFNRIHKNIIETKFNNEVKDIMISAINGTEVTYVGVKERPDGSRGSTGQRVVIDYAE